MATRQQEHDEADSGNGVQIARIGGVPVYLAPSWFLIAALITGIVALPLLDTRPLLGITLGFLQALLLLACVLVHEAAHAVTARAVGMPVVRIVATVWGGHTSMEAGRTTPGRMALVAVAGPAANGVVALLALAAAPLVTSDFPHRLLLGLMIINGTLAVLNLLPGMPLDGGQVLESLVWKVTGDRNRGSVVAGWCGRVLAVGVAVWFVLRLLQRRDAGGGFDLFDLWPLVIASVLWSGATESVRRGRTLGWIERTRVADVMRPAVAVPDSASLQQVDAVGGEVVVVDASGRLVAYLDPSVVAQVPEQARPSTPLSAVASLQRDAWVVEADPAGEVLSVVATMENRGLALAAVVHEGRLVGVVHATDISESLRRN